MDANAKDGYRPKKREYQCEKCPYTIESATKAAIEWHTIIKHTGKTSQVPIPILKKGTKQNHKGPEEEKETDDK